MHVADIGQATTGQLGRMKFARSSYGVLRTLLGIRSEPQRRAKLFFSAPEQDFKTIISEPRFRKARCLSRRTQTYPAPHPIGPSRAPLRVAGFGFSHNRHFRRSFAEYPTGCLKRSLHWHRKECHSVRITHINAPTDPFTAQTVLHMASDRVGIFPRALKG